MIAKQHEKIDPDCARKIADILIRRTNEMMGRKRLMREKLELRTKNPP